MENANPGVSSSSIPVYMKEIEAREVLSRLTLEQALYAAFVVVGGALRFGNLGNRPLNSLEAWNTWAAWQAATGLPGPAELTPTSPLWHSLQTWLFWTGADGDGWARSLAAAAGVLLIVAPWGLRGLMGRPAALTLSALIALDPWLVTFSRLADSAILSATLAVALLAGAAARLSGRGSARLDRTMAAGAGLFLVSGHMAWGFLPVLLAFVLLNRSVLRQSFIGGRDALLWFAVSAVAGATAGLTRLDGIGLISASLTVWLDSAFTAGALVPPAQVAGGYPLGWPMTRLLTDQPLAVFFGLGGLIYLPLSRRLNPLAQGARWPLFLWIWLGWGTLLCLLPGRSPFSLLVLALPLLVGAAHALNDLAALMPRYARSQETLAMFVTLGVLAVSGSLWGIALVANMAFDVVLAQAVAVIATVGIALLVLYGAWSNPGQAAWIGTVMMVVLLLSGSVSSLWQLNFRYAPDRRDSLYAEGGGEGLRQLAQDVNTISAQRAGDPHELSVFVLPAPPTGSGDVLLGWNLRHMRRLTWGAPRPDELAATPAPAVIMGIAAAPVSAPASDYIGSDYVRRVVWQPAELGREDVASGGSITGAGARLSAFWTATLQPRLRWMLQRRADTQPQTERVILWVQRDGADPSELWPVAN